MSSYFTYHRVLSGLFTLCKSLFGINIKDCTGEVDTWHSSVSFFRVFDDHAPTEAGQEIASFYIDPYSRPSEKLAGTWMEPGRERSGLMGTTPFSYLNLNLSPPLAGQECHVSPDQISSLFHEFGHGLQQMLSTVAYSEVSGQRNIEWDSLQTCAKLLEMFSTDPRVIKQLGTDIPTDVVSRLTASRGHLSAYDTMKQLYLSALDLELYVSEEHWQRVVPRVWAQYMPVQLNDKEEDNHPCSMTAIFSDQYPAAYYSLKWSEMIAADVFETFEEAFNDSPAALAVVGRRFRDTYLALGGAVPAKEVYRRFSGRKEPSLDALVRRYNKYK